MMKQPHNNELIPFQPDDMDCPKCGQSKDYLEMVYIPATAGANFPMEHLVVECPTCGYAFAMACKPKESKDETADAG